MEVAEVPRFGQDDAAALAGGEGDPYGTDHLGITWTPKDRHVVITDAGRTIAHAGFLAIEVEVEGTRIPGVGLGGVMVHPTFRGRGIGVFLLEETISRMRSTGRPFALLFCRDVRLAFYERMGWQRVPGDVTVDQESGPLVMPLLTCWYTFDPERAAAPENVRLLGLPF